MNIIDIIAAKKLATQNTSEVVDKANKIVEEANKTLTETNTALEQANTAIKQANTVNANAQQLVNEANQTLTTLSETVSAAEEAVQKVTAIEEQATAAAEKAQAASDSFDTMKEDLLTAAEGLVDEAVVEVVNRELTNLNDHMDQVNTTVKDFESTVALYDEKINYLTDTLPEVNAAAFEADKAARAAQTTADDAAQVARDNKLRVNDLETTTNLLGAQMTMVADNIDAVKTDISTLQTKQSATDTKINELEDKIEKIPSSGGGISNLGTENAGKTVVVDDDGNITAGSITEEEIVKMANALGMYQSNDVIGIEIDYENKVCSRIQGSTSLTPGVSFDKFQMYGGRKRCVVDNTGKIVAFEGEDSYVEDGSVGQVMVYQPKVYYMRNVLNTTSSGGGISITKEQILLSDKKTAGFKLHPLFINESGEELDYVLLPAYEGCIYDNDAATYIKDDTTASVDYNSDMLSSVIDAKPASSITLANFKKLAQNRGEHWTLTNAKAESINQLLMVVEYGTFNIQGALGRGICDLQNSSSKNIALLTGSTSKLGSKSGAALSSKDEDDTSYTDNGKVAISYRGYENPYGNIWRQVDGATFVGTGNNYGGTVTIDGVATTSAIPSASDWFSCFSYDAAYDWLMMPGMARFSPNSSLPIGDYYYVTPNLNGTNECMIGGKASSQDVAGPFAYYAASAAGRTEKSVNARIMYVPTHDSTYTANCEKWNSFIGG